MGTIIQELQAENLLLKKELKEIKERHLGKGSLTNNRISANASKRAHKASE